jgi:hypothetical protein
MSRVEAVAPPKGLGLGPEDSPESAEDDEVVVRGAKLRGLRSEGPP